ncbi:hypothetical protein [Serratia fonticola]|uniref:hypothetical protein n=1 Tax=Serratia fonticola TaxID=47917 RepID=UPI00192A860B|nr:hypothetical protein [Serratia fonticola]MBL5824658.1 hypothetical protein [Serratia fonticola]
MRFYLKLLPVLFIILLPIQDVLADVYFKDLSGVNYLPPGNMATRLGVSWVRENLAWNQVEVSEGVYNWEGFDAKVRKAHEQGLEILPILAYVPEWNKSIKNKIGSPPKDYNRWTIFVQKAINRYSREPFNIKYFQIWNEPTSKAKFWLGTNDDFIYRIYLPAAKIIRSYGGKVVFGGWPASNSLTELDSILSKGNAIDYTDIIDFHYGNVGPYEHLYQKYVLTKKVEGIWQTELGYRSTPDSVLRIYSFILNWVLSHDWNTPHQYKVFWFPSWTSYASQHRGFTTTLPNREVVVTDNGFQLTLLNKLFGCGALSKADVLSSLDENDREGNLVFAVNVGKTKKVIVTLYNIAEKSNGIKYEFFSSSTVHNIELISSEGKHSKLNFSQNNKRVIIGVYSGDYPRECGNCQHGVFFIEVKTD